MRVAQDPQVNRVIFQFPCYYTHDNDSSDKEVEEVVEIFDENLDPNCKENPQNLHQEICSVEKHDGIMWITNDEGVKIKESCTTSYCFRILIYFPTRISF